MPPLPNLAVAMEVVTSLAALVGLLMGCIVGLNGFAQPAAESTLVSEIPRLKNLLWLLSGFAVLVIADPKKLWLPDNFPMFWPCIAYGFAAMFGLVIAIGGTLRSITSSVNFFNANHLPVHASTPAALERVSPLWQSALRRAVREGKGNSGGTGRGTPASPGSSQDDCRMHLAALSPTCSPRRAANRRRRQFAARRDYEGRLRRGARLWNPPSGDQAGWPAWITCRSMQVDEALRRRLKFTTGMPEEYSGYLKFRLGGGALLRDVVLPVAKEDSFLSYRSEALSEMGVAIINLSESHFSQPHVSSQVQNEIRNFFRENYFQNIASVTSLVIASPERICGVLNLESSEPNLLGAGPASAKAMAERLPATMCSAVGDLTFEVS